MRLLVMSHPCVTATNQQFFAEVEAATEWNVTLVLPRLWRSEYGKELRPMRWPAFRGKIVSIPTLLTGRIPLHFYRTHFVRLLRRFNPDLIYAHHEPFGLATAQLCLANAHSIRVPFGFYSAQNMAKRYPWPFSALERWVYRHSSFAFPVSGEVLNVLRTKGYQGEATVLPLGIDPAVHRPAQGRAVRERFGLAGTVFGFIGRLVEEKGLATLLRALAMLPQSDVMLFLVGDGPYRPELEALARELGVASRVAWAGYAPHDEVAAYYSAMDVVVVPSETRHFWKEQFGRVVIEALACGRPVIGSSSGEIPLLVRETGGGLTFKEGDPQDLVTQMRRFLLDRTLAPRIAEKGRQAVLNRYTNGALARAFATGLEARRWAR